MSKDALRYVHTDNLPSLLLDLGISIFVSTYQAGKLIVVRAREGRISTLLRSFDQAMGLAVDSRRLVIKTRNQAWFLRNVPEIAAQLEPVGRHDACIAPRSSHVTDNIRVHDLGWTGEELWLVNTRFSCLCTLDADYSFTPRWHPKFVTAIAAEDRCHLNGLAIVDDEPKYATGLGETDFADGWREHKADKGCLIDVPSGEVITRGLCMPYSQW